MPITNRQTITSGQLGTTAATLLAGENASDTGRLDLICQNVGSNTETIVLTFQTNGATAVRLWRCELAQNEQLKATAIPIQGGDTLLAVTTTASSVDYLITRSEAKSLSFETFSANGTSKGVGTLRQILQALEVIADQETVDLG